MNEYQYDYVNGLNRIKSIFDDNSEINKIYIPNKELFSRTNGYYGLVSTIYISILDNKRLFSENLNLDNVKIIKSYTSEIINILKYSDRLREIGIREGSIYAKYSIKRSEDNIYLYQQAIYINSFMIMLNKVLKEKGLKKISVVIGIALDNEVVFKLNEIVNGNNLVWIGGNNKDAYKLSNKCEVGINLSSDFYNSISKELENLRGYKYLRNFKKRIDKEIGLYYHVNLVNNDYYKWIKENI